VVTGSAIARQTTIITFYSYAGGAGRTCTVANIALILANRGHRVLVADLDLPSPSLYRYLSPFFPGPADSPAALPADPAAPIRLACAFATLAGSVDFLGPTADVVEHPADFAVTREDLLRRGYDYVLIDSPAGTSPGVDMVTEILADVVVVGYNLSKQAIAGAAHRARAVQRQAARRDVRILPVPMRVDVRAHGATERMRTEARRTLTWLLKDMDEPHRQQYWSDVEIPYESDYALEEGLAFLDEPSAQRDHLLDAYLRLASVLAPGGQAADLAPPPDAMRARYRTARSAAPAAGTITTVAHVAADREWAEWLVAELSALGVRGVRRRLGRPGSPALRADGPLLLLMSEDLLSTVAIDDYLAEVESLASPVQSWLAVSVDGSRLPGRFPAVGHIDLAGRTAEEAGTDLAAYFQSAEPPLAEAGFDVRYPGAGAA
jgi:cellulose biosynthesis protein BcsQ